MSAPQRPYVVRQGDYLEQIAFAEGFDAQEVWGDPKNADLRALRPDPRLLCPGDVLYVPASDDHDRHALTLGGDNPFGAVVPEIDLVVRLDTMQKGTPLRYVLEGVGDAREGETEADGTLRTTVPVNVREVAISLPDLGVRVVAQVGSLDPLNEPSGVAQRLANLGWMPRDAALAEAGAVRDASRARALSAFQKAMGLPVTGAPDEGTLAALHKEYGC